MGKLGTSDNPIKILVNNENRMEEIVGICEKNNWKFICGIEPDHPENISELEYMLNPKSFGGKKPKMKQIGNIPVENTEPIIGRNDPCPCGSGKKYKKCCLMK
ncbi:MAG: SEC-C metal-binding domain-containing protein [Bacteroidales bacterium]|nr:SEC-C metal-binding domain-containing protein [Bacteroidales bacterium]MDP3003845.1 SEC-C metal-binding domain-containing protein [Bacteroidales bacterium]